MTSEIIDSLKAEKSELDEKRKKLNDFFKTGTFAGLETEQKRLLERQFGVMTEYSEILDERIALLG